MKILIVVDMQNDFIDGALGTPEAAAIVPNVKKKIKDYFERMDAIVFTQDTHFKGYLDSHEGKYLPIPHCVWGSDGWKIPRDIDYPYLRHLDKYTFGYTMWGSLRLAVNGLEYTIRSFDDIEIIGLCTDICVVSNALMLRSLFPELDITVDASCCAGTTPERHKAALEVMRSCQINIIGE